MFFVFIFSPMGALYNVGLLSIVGLGAALIATTRSPQRLFT
jgi:predicted exporter